MSVVKNKIESGASERPDLEFWGEGKARDIKHGFAVVTLRKPDSEFCYVAGDSVLAYCRDDRKKVPIVILNSYVDKLASFFEPMLALDGYAASDEAARNLRRYPGYEQTTENSRMQAFTFMSKKSFDLLPQYQRNILIKKSVPALIGKREFRGIFFPTILFWIAHNGGSVKTWADYLETYELITSSDLKQLKKFAYHGTNLYEFLSTHQEHLETVAISPDSPLFKPVVLAIFK